MKYSAFLLLLISTSIIASNGYVGFDLVTLNKKIPHHPKNIDLGYDFYEQFNLSKNWYEKASVKKYDHNQWGYSGMVGVTTSEGYLRSYGEVTYKHYPNEKNHHWLNVVDYDAGAVLDTFNRVMPYVQVNNFLKHTDAEIEAGVQIRLVDCLYAKSSFSWNVHNGNNKAKLGLAYAI